jgi:hypothetical protein
MRRPTLPKDVLFVVSWLGVVLPDANGLALSKPGGYSASSRYFNGTQHTVSKT